MAKILALRIMQRWSSKLLIFIAVFQRMLTSPRFHAQKDQGVIFFSGNLYFIVHLHKLLNYEEIIFKFTVFK